MSIRTCTMQAVVNRRNTSKQIELQYSAGLTDQEVWPVLIVSDECCHLGVYRVSQSFKHREIFWRRLSHIHCTTSIPTATSIFNNFL